MAASDNYCIHPEYVSQTVNCTLAWETGVVYWTPRLIHMAKFFQYHVYMRGKELVKRHGLKSVLDIGCGPALKLVDLFSPVCNNIVGLDSKDIVYYCREHYNLGRFLPLDIERDDFPLQETFDLVISSDVIEHLVDPDKLLDAIHRASNAQTFILLSTPDRDTLRGKGCLQSPKAVHVREWNFREFVEYLRSRGFTILEHRLVPPLSFNWSREYFGQWYAQFRARRSFNSCQLVVCRKA